MKLKFKCVRVATGFYKNSSFFTFTLGFLKVNFLFILVLELRFSEKIIQIIFYTIKMVKRYYLLMCYKITVLMIFQIIPYKIIKVSMYQYFLTKSKFHSFSLRNFSKFWVFKVFKKCLLEISGFFWISD